MASRFWVGGTGTWDGSTTTNWAATSGGAGGQTVPGSADTVTFDASSGGGVVTVAASIGGTNTVTSITCGNFTGTLDFSVNNPSITCSTTFAPGQAAASGTRKLLMGTSTITVTGNNNNAWDMTSTTNLDALSDFSSMTFIMGANSTINNQNFVGGGKSYGTFTVQAGRTGGGIIQITGANTFGTFNVNVPANIQFAGGATNTITNAFIWTGTSSSPVSVTSNNTSVATVAATGGGTITWAAIRGITFTGTVNATNSIDLKSNTITSITAPSTTGGAGVIGS